MKNEDSILQRCIVKIGKNDAEEFEDIRENLDAIGHAVPTSGTGWKLLIAGGYG